MIVTCQACTKRYSLDAKAIGDEGRTVRCVNCGNTWHQTLENQPQKDLHVEDVKTAENENLRPASNTNKKRAKKAEQPKKKSRKFLFTLILLAAAATGVVMGREQITQKYPQAASVYARFGLPVSISAVGLSLNNVSIIPIIENGRRGMIIKGSVTNTTDDVLYLPVLQIYAFGNCAQNSLLETVKNFFIGQTPVDSTPQNPQCQVEGWKHRFPETRLFPGEQARFETTPLFTKKAIADLTVSF